MTQTPQNGELQKDVEDRYEAAVSELNDDTGYFDHAFVKKFLAQELSQAYQRGREEERQDKKFNDQALERGLKNFRKLRLVDYEPLMDEAPPSETVLSVLKSGLGGMFNDQAVRFIYQKAIRYYLESLTKD